MTSEDNILIAVSVASVAVVAYVLLRRRHAAAANAGQATPGTKMAAPSTIRGAQPDYYVGQDPSASDDTTAMPDPYDYNAGGFENLTRGAAEYA